MRGKYRIPLSYQKEKYDRHFKKYSEMYIGSHVDWRLLKAQCHTESHFQEHARSPVGAMGLCQFMPLTWKDQERRIRKYGSPYDTELNIQFAAFYMSTLRKTWKWKRPEFDRHSLAMASYNAGTGNLLKSQRKCGFPREYFPIVRCLHLVTGRHSKETRNYVIRTWLTYELMFIGGI